MMFRAPIIYNFDLNTRVQKRPTSLLWGQSEEPSASAAGSWGSASQATRSIWRGYGGGAARVRVYEAAGGLTNADPLMSPRRGAAGRASRARNKEL
jgi:hypothetical protein